MDDTETQRRGAGRDDDADEVGAPEASGHLLGSAERQAEYPAVFTVRKASPPGEGRPGRLVLAFDDASDPGGTVTVAISAVGVGRCRLVPRHVLAPVDAPLVHASGFGARWEGFLGWLDAELSGRPRGVDLYTALKPHYDELGQRLADVRRGTVADQGHGLAAVRHERRLHAGVETVWHLQTSGEAWGHGSATCCQGV